MGRLCFFFALLLLLFVVVVVFCFCFFFYCIDLYNISIPQPQKAFYSGILHPLKFPLMGNLNCFYKEFSRPLDSTAAEFSNVFCGRGMDIFLNYPTHLVFFSLKCITFIYLTCDLQKYRKNVQICSG